MEKFFILTGRWAGKIAGKAAKSMAFDRSLSVAFSYAVTEMKLTDLKARQSFLYRKKQRHLCHLGRITYRLHSNGIGIEDNPNIQSVLDVLKDIEKEISCVSAEIEKRRAASREKPPHDTVEF